MLAVAEELFVLCVCNESSLEMINEFTSQPSLFSPCVNASGSNKSDLRPDVLWCEVDAAQRTGGSAEAH